MKIDGNTFKCRFNVAILDNGYYLPMDKYLLVYHDQLDYIGQLKPNIIDQAYAALNQEQIEEYNELTTQNGRSKLVLANEPKKFSEKVAYHNIRFIPLLQKLQVTLTNLYLMLKSPPQVEIGRHCDKRTLAS